MPEQLPRGGSVGAPPILAALTLGSSGTRPSPRRSWTGALLGPGLAVVAAIAVIALGYFLSPNRARGTKVSSTPEMVTSPAKALVDSTPSRERAAAEVLDDVTPAEPAASGAPSVPSMPIRSGIAATPAGEHGSRSASANAAAPDALSTARPSTARAEVPEAIPLRAAPAATATGTSASSRPAVAPPPNVAEPASGSADQLDFVENRH